MTGSPGTDIHLRYDLWIDEALRGIVRRALAQAAEEGLPGAHHFYITFRTGEPGVVIPEAQRARFPDEMTIVLQHRFWGLTVEDDAFEVVLSFGGQRTPLRIPFAAITGFADPSVSFALQFKPAAEPGAEGAPAAKPESGGERAGGSGAAGPAETPAGERDAGNDAGEKVVALDAFRRKP